MSTCRICEQPTTNGLCQQCELDERGGMACCPECKAMIQAGVSECAHCGATEVNA